MAKTIEIVKEKICPIISELGYEVVDVEYSKKADGMNLTFYIDSPNGITLDDCERVHKAIDSPLDELDPTGDTTYILNVSSCGLDRPIKTDFDLKRNLGKEVDVKLYRAVDKKKQYSGELLAFDSETVTVGDRKFNRKEIANMVLHLDF